MLDYIKRIFNIILSWFRDKPPEIGSGTYPDHTSCSGAEEYVDEISDKNAEKQDYFKDTQKFNIIDCNVVSVVEIKEEPINKPETKKENKKIHEPVIQQEKPANDSQDQKENKRNERENLIHTEKKYAEILSKF